MAGKKATTKILVGDYGLSVGCPPVPPPKNWAWVCLTDVAQMATGHTPSRRESSYWVNGKIPWMSVGDARGFNGRVIYQTKEYTNMDGIKNSAAVVLPKDTVCLSRTASIGYAVMLGIPMATSQGFANWICSEYLNPKFLQMLFLAERDFLNRISEGTAHTTIYFPELKAFHICLPTPAEQIRIVDRLNFLFKGLYAIEEELKSLPGILASFRQSVLDKAITGVLTKQWREENPIESSFIFLTNLKKSRKIDYEQRLDKAVKYVDKKPKPNYEFEFKPHPQIENWALAKLDKLVYIAARVGWKGLKADEYTTEGPLFLSVHSLNYGDVVNLSRAFHIDEYRYEESPEIMLKENDILLCKDGAGIGKLGIVKGLHERATINSSLLIIRGGEAFHYKYLYYFFSGPVLQGIVKSRMTGSAVPHLFQKDIKEFQIGMPPLAEQEAIVSKIEKLFGQADKIEERIAKIKKIIDQLPKAVLGKAFSGRLVDHKKDDGDMKEIIAEIRAIKNHVINENQPSLGLEL